MLWRQEMSRQSAGESHLLLKAQLAGQAGSSSSWRKGFTARLLKISWSWGVMQIIRQIAFFCSARVLLGLKVHNSHRHGPGTWFMKINLSRHTAAPQLPAARPLPFMSALGWKWHAWDDRRPRGGRTVTRR